MTEKNVYLLDRQIVDKIVKAVFCPENCVQIDKAALKRTDESSGLGPNEEKIPEQVPNAGETQKEKQIANYTGRGEMFADSELINEIYKEGRAKIVQSGLELIENQYFILSDKNNPSHKALARVEGNCFVPVQENLRPKKIVARNVGQKFALDALYAPSDKRPLTVMWGNAGTAKTFLALAAGLQLVEDGVYNKILILRPNVKFDEDIGYLKGDEMEKIAPLVRPCFDNIESIIAATAEGTRYAREMVDKLFDKHIIEAEAMAYIRGRSIPNCYIIIDEAQNSTPNQMLGIVTRAGVNSKVVVTGDPNQIDNPKVNSKNNGLVYLCDKMKGSSLCTQMAFLPEECERSVLAAEAAKRLT